MTDSCFICLDNTTGKCDVCSIKCHEECWQIFLKNSINKFFSINSINKYFSINCPQCGSPIRITNVHVFLKESYQRLAKINGSKNRIVISKEIHDCLYENMWFVNMITNFHISIKNKLIFMYLYYEQDYPENMYKKMFGIAIPFEFQFYQF